MTARLRLTNRLIGLLSLITLVALVAGLPALLVLFGVLPTHVPSLGEVGNALTQPDDGRIFLGALTVIGWVSWGAFAWSVVVEARAAMQGRRAARLPVVGVSQWFAATLISGVTLLGSTGPAAAAGTLAAPATVAAGVAVSAPAVPVAGTTERDAVDEGFVGPVHRVSSAKETVWDIAASRLGDGQRWKEIAELNHGLTQPDGTSLSRENLTLKPGYVLQLPPDARPTEAASANQPDGSPSHPQGRAVPAALRADTPDGAAEQDTETGTKIHTVRKDECLWCISEDDLGTKATNAEIDKRVDAYFTLNKGRPQPGGGRLVDPDHIEPGWRLIKPELAAVKPTQQEPRPAQRPPRPALPDEHSASDHRAGAERAKAKAERAEAGKGTERAERPSPSQTAGPTSAPSAGSSAAPAVPAPPAVSTPATPPATPATPHQRAVPSAPASPQMPVGDGQADEERAGEDSEVVGVETGTLIGVGALLASGLLSGLWLKRVLQQRRRRPGETIAIRDEPSDLEAVLAIHQEPASVALLDTALRTLAVRVRQAGRDLPMLRGARVTPDDVELLTNHDEDPIVPFVTGGPQRWRLDPDAPLLGPDDAVDVPAPYPGLVAVGTDSGGSHVLVDVEHAGVVLISGSPEQVRAVVTAAALEAATSEWADHLEVVCVGFGEELPGRIPKGRVRHVADFRRATIELGYRLTEARQALDTAGVATALQARSRGVAEAAWMPLLLVVSDAVAGGDAWELAEIVSRASGAGLAVVLPATGVEPLFPDAATWDADVVEPQRCDSTGVEVALQRLPEDAYRQLVHDLELTEEEAEPAEGVWTQVPGDAEDVAEDPASDEQRAAASTPVVVTTSSTTPSSSDSAAWRPAGDGTQGQDQSTGATDTDRHGESTGQPSAGEESPTAVSTGDPAGQDPATVDLRAPEVRVLGQLHLEGVDPEGAQRQGTTRASKLAELAAYLYFRPGRDAEDVREAMGGARAWSTTTLTARISELRTRLGTDPDGRSYVAHQADGGPYRLSDRVRCDWTRFEALAERGLKRGRKGIEDLENALALVQGRPFSGRPYIWAEPLRQRMISRIVDVAHTIALWRTIDRNYDAARRAIELGLDVEPAAELLYQDWIKLEDRAGNPAGVRNIIEQLNRINARLGVDMEEQTEQTIAEVLRRGPGPAA
jgi:DNA-binding SARP family transcriptional activator